MNPTTTDIEERLDRIVNLYEKLDEWMDMIPGLPDQARNKIKKTLLEDRDMMHLINGIKNRHPPRFMLTGRTGAGKSSLINAICGRYVAKVSHVEVGTSEAKEYSYKSLGKTLFDVIDTRGLAELPRNTRNERKTVFRGPTKANYKRFPTGRHSLPLKVYRESTLER